MKKLMISILAFLFLALLSSCSSEMELCEVSFSSLHGEQTKSSISSDIDGCDLSQSEINEYSVWYLKATSSNGSNAYGQTVKFVRLDNASKSKCFSQGSWDFEVVCLKPEDAAALNKSSMQISDLASASIKDYLYGRQSSIVNLNSSSISIPVCRFETEVTYSSAALSFDYSVDISSTPYEKAAEDFYFVLEFIDLATGEIVNTYTPSNSKMNPYWTETTMVTPADSMKGTSKVILRKLSGTYSNLGSLGLESGKSYIVTISTRNKYEENPIFVDTVAFVIKDKYLTEIEGSVDDVHVNYYCNLDIKYVNEVEIASTNVSLGISNEGTDILERSFHPEATFNIGNGRNVPYYECHVDIVTTQTDIVIPIHLSIPNQFLGSSDPDIESYVESDNNEDSYKAKTENIGFDADGNYVINLRIPCSATSSFLDRLHKLEVFISVVSVDNKCGEIAVGFIIDVDCTSKIETSVSLNDIFDVDSSNNLYVKSGYEKYLKGAIELPTPTELGKDYTGIKNEAFKNCSALTYVTIPANVQKVGNSAFANLSGLVGVTFMNQDVELGEYAFSYCYSLENVFFLGTHKEGTVKNWGKHVFNSCHSLKSISLPACVKQLKQYAFGSCMDLESIEIPASLTTLSDRPFARCINLVEITAAPNGTFHATANTLLNAKNEVVMVCAGSVIPGYVTRILENAITFATKLEFKFEGTSDGWKTLVGNSASGWCNSTQTSYFDVYCTQDKVLVRVWESSKVVTMAIVDGDTGAVISTL